MNTSDARATGSPLLKPLFFSIVGCIVVYQAVLAFGLFADLEFADESGYLENGRHFLDFWFQDGFFYFVYYGIFHALIKDPVHVYFLNYLSGSFFFFLAVSLPMELRFRFHRYAGLPSLLGILMATNFSFLTAWPFITKFAALVLVFPLLVTSVREVSPRAFRIIVLVTLFLAQYVRPEFSLSFFLFLLYSFLTETISMLRNSEPRKVFIHYAAVAGFIVFAGLFAFTHPVFGTGRSFVAFGQHYALRMSLNGEMTSNPWMNWQTIIEQDFGQSQSLLEAAGNNPPKFFSHVLHNSIDFLRKGMLSGLSFWILILFLFLVHRFLADRHQFVSRIRSHLDLVFFLVVAVLPIIAAVLLIYPRPHYALLLAPFLVYAMLRFAVSFNAAVLLPAILVAASLILSADLIKYPSLVPNTKLGPCSHIFQISFLNSYTSLPDHLKVVSEEGSFCMYLNKRECQQVSLNKDRGWKEALENTQANIVFLGEKLRNNSQFARDPDFKLFQTHPDRFGFRMVTEYTCPEVRMLVKGAGPPHPRISQ